jgi:arsenite-transporting ATPase
LGPLSGLKAQRDRYARVVRALADPTMTVMVLVARPERTAIAEAARTSAELRKQGMTNQVLALNGLFHATDRDDPLALAFERRTADAVLGIPSDLAALPRIEVPLHGWNVMGLDALRRFFAPDEEGRPNGVAVPAGAPDTMPDLATLIADLARSGHGLVMVMGKGGVGKTTIAAAIAFALAYAGRAVHLTTTDPAQHLSDTVGAGLPNLRMTVIDPKEEARRYRERTLQAAAATQSPEKVALLAEELQSPCYDEVAVFQAFARTVMR